MQTSARNVLLGFLSLMVVASGWPVYLGSDRNHNDDIDLQDVILSIRSLTISADQPDGFMDGMANALTAMNILSGLKTVIKAPKNGTGFGGMLSSFDHSFLISTHSQCSYDAGVLQFFRQEQIFHAPDLEPEFPPPKA